MFQVACAVFMLSLGVGEASRTDAVAGAVLDHQTSFLLDLSRLARDPALTDLILSEVTLTAVILDKFCAFHEKLMLILCFYWIFSSKGTIRLSSVSFFSIRKSLVEVWTPSDFFRRTKSDKNMQRLLLFNACFKKRSRKPENLEVCYLFLISVFFFFLWEPDKSWTKHECALIIA